MSTDQLHGHYSRLRQELAAAYGSLPWNTGHIDRLTEELAAVEREIAATTVGNRVVKTPWTFTDSSRSLSH